MVAMNYKIIEYCIMIAILVLLIGVIIVGNEEKQLYQDCNMKILCNRNKLNPAFKEICQSINDTVPNFTINKY
jgi:hypothetical protein